MPHDSGHSVAFQWQQLQVERTMLPHKGLTEGAELFSSLKWWFLSHLINS
jgi:hypothetical protein